MFANRNDFKYTFLKDIEPFKQRILASTSVKAYSSGKLG